MMYSLNYRRVIKDLCDLVGFRDHEILLKGGKLRIDDYRISFIYSPNIYSPNRDAENLLVYVDMGMPSGNREQAYETLLKINFELGIGNRGVISVHPNTNRLFYSFGFLLNDAASGRALLDTLIRFAGDAALGAIDLLPEKRVSPPLPSATGSLHPARRQQLRAEDAKRGA